ncbi:MAG: DMT family transporter [Anaerovoracaceae bacterium]
MKKAYIFVVITACLFATMEVALKLAGNNLDPFQITFLRFFIGGILLIPFAIVELKQNGTKLSLKDFGYLTYVGILGIPLSMLFFQLGVMNANASTASVLISINPLFTMIFAHFMTSEKLNRPKIVVLLFGLLGIIFMIRPWQLQEGNTPLGIIFMLLAALFFGLYTVAGKISIKKMGIMAQTSFSFIIGSLVLLVVILFMGRPVISGVVENIWVVLYVAIFVTGLGYYCYFMAIKLSDATTGSIAFFIKPAIAPFIAVAFLGDKILWNTYVGIILILIGSYLNFRQSKKEVRLNVPNNHEQIEDTSSK